MRKLTDQQVADIKQRLANGERVTKIANTTGIPRTTISHIKHGRTHSDGQVNPTDKRVMDLTAENHLLKDEANKAKAEARRVGKSHGVFRALAEELECLSPFTPPKPVKLPTRKPKITESLVMHLSDGHHDEIVLPEECGGLEEYNFGISCRRAERYVDTVLDFTQNALSNYEFSDLTILAYGDHTSGEIHNAVDRSQYRNMFKNTLAIGQLHALMYRDLSQYFNVINLLYLPGNHGRRSPKKDHHGAHDNWDYLVAKTAEQYCRDLDNVHFAIPNAFSMDIEIAEHIFNVSHGDDVRGHAGIPAYGMLRRHGNIMKLSQVSGKQPVKYTIMGHHHLQTSIQDMDGYVICNGAWVGTNAYAYNSFAGYREPSQLIHGAHPRRGVTWRMDVQLRGPEDADGPERYQIEV